MKVRESLPDVWSSTARIMLASAFLATLLSGRWCPMSESDVVGTGLWNCPTKSWDETSLDLLAGGKEEAARLREMLGEVESSGSAEVGLISSYFVERYGLRPGELTSCFKALVRERQQLCSFLRRWRHSFHFRQPFCIPLDFPFFR